MSEGEHQPEIDISDIIDDTDPYLENDYRSTEITDSELSVIKDSEEQNNLEKKTQNVNKVEVIRSTKLPIARIKNIMKMDPDVNIVNAEAVFLVTKATVSSSVNHYIS